MNNVTVSAAWLSDHLGDAGLRIVDASWYMPAQNRNARAEFEQAHIPGAVFFDIDATSDGTSSLPHMLPDEATFAATAGALGIAENDRVVVYDGAGLFSAARAWWTFRVFGARDVVVLDGGLPAWREAGLPLEQGPASPVPARFDARLDREAVANYENVLDILQSGAAQVVDARAADRFTGATPEPRAGLKSGHMPGARNLPFNRLVTPEGTLAAPEAIRASFQGAGVDLSRPVVTSCGSGVTAAVLSLALAQIGKEDVRLYDGSWTEWGGKAGAPVVTGEP
ncbi:thiosulfate/3-mercaptopyruvate sulfurtransferase [Faunimonas pinastri]|uniref:Sulfurtransferase n=1 Tax=Faunimonas pinastri TaxID=1855383 RepID=A0A1H9CIQ8_9HYPH|nr:3-mercaptopyruvate sulfurtransferase [Faunimonas pinastri]SEQ01059.1 thiosulfate/3-mercaptopyruvate sulfurtransferase [Faunimonas pinastri]